jgi:hypothetical protein
MYLGIRQPDTLCPQDALCSTNTSVDSQQPRRENRPRVHSGTTEQTFSGSSVGFIDIINIPQSFIQEKVCVIDISINVIALKYSERTADFNIIPQPLILYRHYYYYYFETPSLYQYIYSPGLSVS